MQFKLGKLPARPDAVKLKMASYIDFSKFPPPPPSFGHDAGITGWGMLGNDNYGDCVWAGAAHETILWDREAAHKAKFTEANVLSDYTAVTGFKPNDPNTDQGTDMSLAAKYRQKTGVIDKYGKRHTVAAYLALRKGNLEEHILACYLFGAVGLGIEVPSSADQQFSDGRPWDVVPGDTIEGGHYVPLVGRGDGFLRVVTWGKVQKMTTKFFETYNDESIAYVSLEALTNNKSPEGFDAQTLLADLGKLK